MASQEVQLVAQYLDCCIGYTYACFHTLWPVHGLLVLEDVRGSKQFLLRQSVKYKYKDKQMTDVRLLEPFLSFLLFLLFFLFLILCFSFLPFFLLSLFVFFSLPFLANQCFCSRFLHSSIQQVVGLCEGLQFISYELCMIIFPKYLLSRFGFPLILMLLLPFFPLLYPSTSHGESLAATQQIGMVDEYADASVARVEHICSLSVFDSHYLGSFLQRFL